MHISLPHPSELPLTPAALCDLAVKANVARTTMQDAHIAFEQRSARIRSEVASRYDSDAFRGISSAERRRVAESETAARVFDARKATMVTMDAIAVQQIAPVMAAVNASKSFYKSAANTLTRMTLDSPRRDLIASNLRAAGPFELWHAAIRALQNADSDLAAALVHTLHTLPLEQRPFGIAEFASRFAFEPHEKAVNAINCAERDTQAAILLWRTVQHARNNPLGRLQVAFGTSGLAEAEDGAVPLSEPAVEAA